MSNRIDRGSRPTISKRQGSKTREQPPPRSLRLEVGTFRTPGTRATARCRRPCPAKFVSEGESMKQVILALAAIAGVTAGLLTVGTARAEDKKEVKLTGTLVCGKCMLKATEKCSNALQ